MAAAKKGGLGRGLDALFADVPVTAPEEEKKDEKGIADIPAEDRVNYIGIHEIMPNVNQPRKTFPEEKIEELADSIREHGIIQPIVVRKKQKGYEIVAGERRWRAAMKAGLSEVPCLLRELSDEQNMLIAIIENMQREDLNPIEEASGIQRLIDDCGYTHEEAAQAIGRSRSGVTNMLRLLGLTEEVKQMVTRGELEMGHARALLALEGAEQILVAKDIAARGLSVRQTEDLVSKRRETRPAKKKVVIKTRDDLRLEEALAESLGAVVKLTANQKGRGRIVIEFANLDQLQGIVDRIQQRLE